MYLSRLTIENFRCFGEGDAKFDLQLRQGLTALVGENDSGKSAVIDALRLALGTTDQEWYRIEDTDFHSSGERRARQIRITCVFEELTLEDKQAFVEHLTYNPDCPDKQLLYVTWTAKDTGQEFHGRAYRRVEMRSGKAGDGLTFDEQPKQLLRATYLRPLRDAEEALSAGRGSRLSQVLRHSPEVTSAGAAFSTEDYTDPDGLSVLGIVDLADHLLGIHAGVRRAREQIAKHLAQLEIAADALNPRIGVHGANAASEVRLRQALEKLDLALDQPGRAGLGSNNLLFAACELLLTAQEAAGSRLLLIEEPEAHLHPQRQLRVMKYLQDQASEHNLQVIVTTHSPNLASVVKLGNMVVMQKGHPFPLSSDHTRLDPSDYRFLERFLDVTKANLFFARGVLIVEGDSENILLPVIAELIGRDFTTHGVSVVNVGGVGLRRYAKIFQRAEDDPATWLDVPVACVTDMDVMPDCAPEVIGKVGVGEEWPDRGKRRWHARRDYGEAELAQRRVGLEERASGQHVRTFVSDEWTLEYDLALGRRDEHRAYGDGLAEEVFTAASLASDDGKLCAHSKRPCAVIREAKRQFARLSTEPTPGCSEREVRATHVYARFLKDSVSKPMAAQYLAEILRARQDLRGGALRERLPKYITDAIDHVTGFERGDAGEEEAE